MRRLPLLALPALALLLSGAAATPAELPKPPPPVEPAKPAEPAKVAEPGKPAEPPKAAEPAKKPAEPEAPVVRWLTSRELSLLPRAAAVEKEGDRIKFSHKLHKGKAKADCVDCHQSVADSETAAGSVKMKEAGCFDGCHDPETEREGNCGMCHTDEKNPSATFAPGPEELIFDHKAHLGRKDAEGNEIECKSCHPDAAKSTNVADDNLPKMELCETCHQAEVDRLACKACHERLPELAEKPMGEAIHKAGFFQMHAAWATGNGQLCVQCHEQHFCADCHERTGPMPPATMNPGAVERTFIHRGDFLGRHAMESVAKPASCQTCHGASFCQECHEERAKEVGFTGGTFGGHRSPHPPGYVRKNTGTKYHGLEARLNIGSCVACHDQGAASNCVDCHKVGGPGGDPHPPGWKRRGMESEKNSGRACVPCHDGG